MATRTLAGTVGHSSDICEESKHKRHHNPVLLLGVAGILYCAARGSLFITEKVSSWLLCRLGRLNLQGVWRLEYLDAFPLVDKDDETEPRLYSILITAVSFSRFV